MEDVLDLKGGFVRVGGLYSLLLLVEVLPYLGMFQGLILVLIKGVVILVYFHGKISFLFILICDSVLNQN